jgi:hypothetical protein
MVEATEACLFSPGKDEEIAKVVMRDSSQNRHVSAAVIHPRGSKIKNLIPKTPV